MHCETPRKSIPLLSTRDGGHDRDSTAHFEEPLNPNEGGSVGLLILILIYFIAGLVIGAWLW